MDGVAGLFVHSEDVVECLSCLFKTLLGGAAPSARCGAGDPKEGSPCSFAQSSLNYEDLDITLSEII